MKKIAMLLSLFLFVSVGSTAFGGAIEIAAPYARVKVVQPKVVQRAVIAPTSPCVPAVAAVPCASVKVVQPRVVQRSVVAACPCETVVPVDPTRLAKVKTVQSRLVQRSVVPSACGCGSLVGIAAPRPAAVKVVYPRTVMHGMTLPPPAYNCCPAAGIAP